MPLSQSDLRAMAIAASTIPERMDIPFCPKSGQMEEQELQARLCDWCQISAEGDWQRYEERLSWDGLDLDGARRLLAPREWPEQIPLPTWTETLQEVVYQLETRPDGSMRLWPFVDAEVPLPFEDLLAPFVSLSQQHWREQVASSARLLTDGVQVTLQRHLLQVLTSLAMPTLHAEFVQASIQSQSTTDGTGNPERNGYQHFLQHMRQGGLASVLRTYSVLARLLATTCDQWVAAHVEFVQRLAADRPALAHLFDARSELGSVTEIQPALSDAHSGRRCVMGLTFASGRRLIYKPRSVGVEESFSHLLKWCNEQGATPPLKPLTVLDRKTYGWVEYIEQQPCQNKEALRRYYQRAGMLLCLVYVLRGAACFSDQLVAHGDQPVLVDASHLMHPFASPHPQQREGEDWEQVVYTVLHTGLLASWRMPIASPAAQQQAVIDISGLGLENGMRTPDAQQHLSPQQQMLKYGSFKLHDFRHIATVVEDSAVIPEEDMHSAICEGFERMSRLLLQQRHLLLAAEGPLQSLRTQTLRFAYRDRQVYRTLLPTLLEPEALRDGVIRSMQLEKLGRDSVPVEWFRGGPRDVRHWWAVFAAERQALLQGDIPVMSARADYDGLMVAPDQEVASCLCQPPFDLLLSHLEHVSDETMEQQRAFLEQAVPHQVTSVVTSRESAELKNPPGVQIKATLMERYSQAIADGMARHAIKIGPDSVTWLSPAVETRFQRYQFRPMRPGFADGICGTAFFLAALAKQTGSDRYRYLAQCALRPLHSLLPEQEARLKREMCLGASLGLGSVVYALTRSSQWLDDPALLTAAQAVARLITPEIIAADRLLDVHLGTAGAILGLLALYSVVREQEVLDRAICCGQHLLQARTPSVVGHRAWPIRGHHATGFSHGAAGIVYALLRLYAVTGDTDLLEAAQEGLRYEACAFVQEKGNWVEEVGQKGTDVGISWCHGAPGIGLARLGGLHVLDTPAIRRDIEISLQTTRQFGTLGVDHLCCGTCGRAEFLLTAAARLGRPELANLATQWLGQVFARAEQRGAFSLDILPRWVAHPGLFYGMAGIGYTMLRLAQPEALPSVLLWE